MHDNGKELALTRHLTEMLMLLELQCDAFGAINTAYLGYDPFAFLDWLHRVARKFPDHAKDFHPVESVRRGIVSGVLPGFPKAVSKKRVSPLLIEIKTALESRK